MDNRKHTALRKSFLIAVLLAILAGGAIYHISKAKCFQLVGDVICRAEITGKKVALSFDDGPTPQGVDAVVPILEAHGVKATFFLIGERMERYPNSVRKLLAAGHELGNHSYSHQRNLFKSQGFYRSEVRRTQSALKDAGSQACWFRPPFGKRLIGLPIEVERAGLTTVTWDVEDRPESFDGDPEAYAADIVARARPGSIILMHPMYRHNQTAREALPLVLMGVQERGYEIVTIGELLRDAES